ncbi:tyrosine-type recombinase/integrase [Celeribacter halophilus]|uniref:tyrosine-type recombinase/integrase n=1 Tax=Celeribacter halophilus TaxID=576117 RepID=UPI001C0938B5|nr:tyrosine-type recombinase/integrase [Celeribacter halophilus]MBU2889111.1 site-specific integrase [Celeribacter halophilus]MDO6510362.1 tyrosine-type recombinase/integrase [Celeribacter halophilus]
MRKYKLPKGVHRVRRKLVSGVKYHFYAWRGGPKFWEDSLAFPNCAEFYQAYSEVTQPTRGGSYLVENLVDDFLSSAALPKAKRSQDDVKLWVNRFRDEFGPDSAAMFEERASRGELNVWRKKWKHSPKQHDMAGVHAVRVLNWAVEEGKLKEHHCHKLKKLYKPNRSEIVWTTDDLRAFKACAPNWVSRILVAGCETGLRVSDLVKVRLDQFEETPYGRRLLCKTNKRQQMAYIPVTAALAELIEETPRGQETLLVNKRGKPLTARWASNQITKWRREAKVLPWEDGREKTLADTRGTAATRLLNADLSLRQIATLMGWSIRYAAQVIESYARVSPDESDEVLARLDAESARLDAEKGRQGT